MTAMPPLARRPDDAAQRSRNARVQAWLSVAILVLALVGLFVQVHVAAEAGLYLRARRLGGWGGLPGAVHVTAGLVGASLLVMTRVNDGERYVWPVRGMRPMWSRGRDALVVCAAGVAMIAWGELAVRPTLLARAWDERYLSRVPLGAGPDMLVAGIGDVMIAYYLTVAVILLVHVGGLALNPVTAKRHSAILDRFLTRRGWQRR